MTKLYYNNPNFNNDVVKITQTSEDALSWHQKRIRCQNQILVAYNLFYTPMNDFDADGMYKARGRCRH